MSAPASLAAVGRRAALLPAAAALGAAAWMVLVLLAGGGAPSASPPGLPDPGATTGWAVPLLRLAADLLAVLTVAALLVPLLQARGPADRLTGRSRQPLVAARRAALVWAAVVVAQAAFTLSDLLAVPVWELGPLELRSFAVQVDLGRALLAQALLAGCVALVAWWSVTVKEAAALLLLALAATVPPALTGHSAASGSHDLAVVALVLHVTAVTVWVGGVGALWWAAVTGSARGGLAVRRFARVAGVALAVTVVSGLLGAWVRLGDLPALVTTGYGAVVLLKLALLAAVATVGLALRRRLAGAGRGPDLDTLPRGLLVRLTGLELTVMALLVAVGVALSRTPTPVGEVYTSAGEALLGGPVPPPPTAYTLLFSFTPSGVGLLVVSVGLSAYLLGVRRLRRAGSPWPLRRTAAWVGGLAVIGYATVGGLGWYANALFSAHMAAHMLLSMVGPALLVLGAPLTLALRALPGSDDAGSPGPRQLLARALNSRPARVLTNPLVTVSLFVVSLYAVYLTPLFGTLMESHLGHAWMEVHFLLTGFLFFDSLIGVDPLPHRPPHLARLGFMLVAVPFHAFFSVGLMSSSTVVGGEYYAALDRGFAADLLADQYLGGALSWSLGEVPMLIVGVALLVQWRAQDRREARRLDRREDRDPDHGDLAAYNAMLRRLNERRPPTP